MTMLMMKMTKTPTMLQAEKHWFQSKSVMLDDMVKMFTIMLTTAMMMMMKKMMLTCSVEQQQQGPDQQWCLLAG